MFWRRAPPRVLHARGGRPSKRLAALKEFPTNQTIRATRSNTREPAAVVFHVGNFGTGAK